jgi:hypothetical protein
MRHPLRTAVLAALLVLGLLPAGAPAAEVQADSSDNIDFVKNIAFEERGDSKA